VFFVVKKNIYHKGHEESHKEHYELFENYNMINKQFHYFLFTQNTMKHHLLLLLLIPSIIGCSRLERPNGLPELYPCSISATFGGQIIENVSVQLKPAAPENKWGAGGKTDAKGVAVMNTAVGFDGVPEGKYIISFTKTEARSGFTVAEMMPKSLIPLKYSPLKSKEAIEVKPEENVFTFALDAGEEITPPRRGAINAPRPR
jgi:hypothetical protein